MDKCQCGGPVPLVRALVLALTLRQAQGRLWVSPPQTGPDCAAGTERDPDPGRAEDDIPQCPGGLLLHRSRSDRPDESRSSINGLVVSIGAREDGGGCAGSPTGDPPPLRGRGAIRL